MAEDWNAALLDPSITVCAVVLTPLWMTLLAGTLVEVKPINMMLEIIKIVLVPIGAALIHDYLKTASVKGRKIIWSVGFAGILWAGFLAAGGWNWMQSSMPAWVGTAAAMLGFLLGAFWFGAMYHQISLFWPQLDERIPVLSMAGVVYFTAVTTAAGRDNLLHAGAMLLVVAIILNAAGYFFGYYAGRAAGLDKNSARSIAFEVGLQNGGMATGIAGG